MYYRVKKYQPGYMNMSVLDQHEDLEILKSRTTIEDCAGLGARTFRNPKFITSQKITCTSLGGRERNSDIIKQA